MGSKRVSWRKHPIRAADGSALDLSIGEVGSGKPPVVTVTSLIHGDEPAGLMAMERILSTALKCSELSGTVRFIPVANTDAFLASARCSPLDGVDPNRVGVGNALGGPTERLVASLYEAVLGSAVVINFHEFETCSPFVCVLARKRGDSLPRVAMESALAMRPEMIWAVDGQNEDVVMESFDMAVTRAGTPSFAAEFPRLEFLTEEVLSRVSKGFLNVLALHGLVEGFEGTADTPPIVGRVVRRAPSSGIWKPDQISLLKSVDRGQRLGELMQLPAFEPTDVFCRQRGVLIGNRPSEAVRVGDILFSVGVPADHFYKEFWASRGEAGRF